MGVAYQTQNNCGACPICGAPLGHNGFCVYCYIRNGKHPKSGAGIDGPTLYDVCHQCGERALVRENGCAVCRRCAWSACS